MKGLMKKLSVVMIALAAVIAVAGTGISVEAAKKPTKMTLKATSKTVDVKGKVTVSVKSVSPAKASKSVTWKSSNKKIAKVNSKGVVTGLKKGTVKITATSKVNKKVKKSVTIKVKDLKPTSVSLNKSTSSLNPGSTVTLKATVKPVGLYNKGVTWTSSNTSVATVDSKGKVTAKAFGTTTITVKTKESGKKAKCTVTVRKVSTDGVTVVPSTELKNNKNAVVVDARLADVYQGWALEGATKGGHIKNAVNISAQWLDCYYNSNKKENKTREESIQKELDANKMTTDKSYIVYDTNGTDAIKVAKYLMNKGYKNVVACNAADLINGGAVELVSYKNYDLWVPAEVVKEISDYVVTGKSEELSKLSRGVIGKSKDVIILNVAWGDESNDPNTGSGYVDKHVPGAVHVNSDEYETPKVYVNEKSEAYATEWRLNSDKALLALAGSKGISKDSCVIVTGGEAMATTRMAVILKYLGCENVHVMSEGLVGWDAKGYKYESGSNKNDAVNFGYAIPQNPDLIDTIGEAKKLVNSSNYQLIDTRTVEEWNGTSSGYGYHDLMGRIEGTISSPSGVGYSSSMYYYRNPDRSMRSQNVIEAMWKEQGIDTSKHMAFFCGSGWRAAEELWDALAMGYTDVSLYSDGWIGWSNEGNPYLDKDGNKVFYDKTQNKVVPVK